MFTQIREHICTLLTNNGIPAAHIADIGGILCENDARFFAVCFPDADFCEKLSDADALVIAADAADLDDEAFAALVSSVPDTLPIVLCALNFSHKNIVLSALEGHALGAQNAFGLSRRRFFTPDVLCAFRKKLSLASVDTFDVSDPDFHPEANRYIFGSNGSDTAEYVSYIGKIINASSDTLFFVRLLKKSDMPASQAETEHPFLSVLTRTQGRRHDALSETLLCMCAQSCTDFEVMIVAHNVEGEQEVMVKSIIDSQPAWLREKIRYIPVNGGTRTTPLNAGFEAARGDYVAVLDDDDIVFDNWVEEFKAAADKRPGTLLHAYTFSQQWRTVVQPNGVDALAAVGPFDNKFCTDFDLLNELNENTCPPCGLAFPRHAFVNYGIHFDEKLNTAEDWDFIMRTAFVCSVSDIHTPTALYRMWTNAENSHTIHNEDAWIQDYLHIRKKFENQMLLINPKTTYTYMHKTFPKGVQINNYANIWYDSGNGFSPADVIGMTVSHEHDVAYECPVIINLDQVHGIRFVMPQTKLVKIRSVAASVRFEDGTEQNYTLRDMTSNGRRRGKSYVFYTKDPMFTINERFDKKIVNVAFTPNIHDFGAKLKKTIPYRILRKIIQTVLHRG